MQHAEKAVVALVDRAGVEGAAVRLGVTEAALRRRRLDLVGAHTPAPDPDRRPAGWMPRDAVEALLADTAAAVRATHPGLAVRAVLAGEPGAALISRSRGAEVVVLGADGPAGLGEQVAVHAAAPVVVARRARRPGGPVVLGVDGSSGAREAAAVAFDEALLRGVALVAVYAWPGFAEVALSGVDPFSYDVRQARDEACRVLAETLAGWSDKYPDVPVEHHPVLAAHAGQQLVTESADASMLVLGARSEAASGEPFLGSVTRFVLRDALCPVAVWPAR